MGDQVLAVKDGSLLFDDVYFFGHANATEAIPASVGGMRNVRLQELRGRELLQNLSKWEIYGNFGDADLPCWI